MTAPDMAPGGVRVKPLAWELAPLSYPAWREAETGLAYEVHDLSDLGPSWTTSDDDFWHNGYITIDDAKAAAQADYDRHIRAALADCDALIRDALVSPDPRVIAQAAAGQRLHDLLARVYANSDCAGRLSWMDEAGAALTAWERTAYQTDQSTRLG